MLPLASANFFLVSIFLFFTHSLQAVRWPFNVMPHTQKNVFNFCKNKRVIRSHIKMKKMISAERIQILFPGQSLVVPVDQEWENVLRDTCKRRSTKVQVLLAKAAHTTKTMWHFVSPQGFLVQLYDNSDKIKKTIKMSAVTIGTQRGFLLCNNKRVTRKVRLRSISGYGECNGITYDGDFIITPYKDDFLCINQVDLEDYVTAVLKTESWPGWPLEVNKVFAIASRSYAMFKIMEAQRSGRPYHVKNTNVHQTYRGKHELPLLKTAVDQTRGVVLGFKGTPILAMFDCCCGGVIPGYIEDFDFDKAPYLARMYACHFCKESSLYSWQVSYEHHIFEVLAQQYVEEIVRLSHIHIMKKDKAGLVMAIQLKGPKHTITVSGKQLYSLFKEVKSFHFDVQKKLGKIIFTGRGFGHHIGLCQWGARQMVRDGWDYKSILRFYYPGAYFMHLI